MTERGSAPLVLVVLLFAGTVLLGVAVDITRIGIAWRDVSHLAATAAEAGSGWIDVAAAREDRLAVDPVSAIRAARTVASGPNRTVTVAANADRVCVTVGITVRPGLLAAVGAAPHTVSATACAEPRRG